MPTITVTLPDSLKAFVENQVSQCGFGTTGEYIRELIRKYQDRLQLRSLILDGAGSESTMPADAAYFSGLRDRIRKAGHQG